MDRSWQRTLVAPFKGDGHAVQRVSAAALLGTLVPLGLAATWFAHPHTRPAPALLMSSAVLLAIAARCLFKRPVPGWVWAIQVVAVPAWWYALQLDVARPPDAYLVLMLVLPVGWVGSWLSLRATVLAIVLESAALAAATLRGGAAGANMLETATGIGVIAVVGLMGYSQLVALREARTAAEADAYTDPLTGARSRRYGLVRLEAELGREHMRGLERPALVMLDIDRFKLVNDAYGHPIGDEVMRELVHRVRASLRAGDELIRWGGEEFLILLPHTIDPGTAMTIAERVRCAAAERPFATEAGPIPITISAGVAMVADTGETTDTVIARTDAALYAAKRGGRNCVWAARRATAAVA
jgi:diguanylate cyclase (GGDEF)-like protein